MIDLVELHESWKIRKARSLIMNTRIIFIIMKKLQKICVCDSHFFALKFFYTYTKILQQENDYHKRKFLELVYTNKCCLIMNIKSNEYFFHCTKKINFDIFFILCFLLCFEV